jgi:hypothetical protein
VVNHLKPDTMEVFVKIDEKIMQALLRSGRLQWHQRADDLAIQKALKQLIDDLVHGGSM